MLLDKLQFLEKAVETSVFEILEEVDVIKDGSDPKISADFIASVAKDLLESIKNFESFSIEEYEEPIEKATVEKPSEKRSSRIDRSSAIAYEIGDTIILRRDNAYLPATSLYLLFDLEHSSIYCDGSYIKIGEEAFILDIKPDPYASKTSNCYLIEQNGNRFFLSEFHLSLSLKK